MNDVRTVLAAAEIFAVSIAAIAWVGDWRRVRRHDPDKVGFMPWTDLFFWSVLASVVLLGLCVRAWLAG